MATTSQHELVTLKISDGSEMRAYVSRPQGAGPHPGMMVFQEAFGVNPHIRSVADRFAREGYTAIAPELFHRTAEAGFEGRYDDFPGVMNHVRSLTEQGMEADIRAAFGWLEKDAETDSARIACVGYCMGGRAAFLADAATPVRAAISFYGGGIAPSPAGPGLLGRAPELHAPLLMFWGGLDQHILPEHHRAVADALRASGKKFINVEISDADHGFFCDARRSYNKTAAAEAWALCREFLAASVKA